MMIQQRLARRGMDAFDALVTVSRAMRDRLEREAWRREAFEEEMLRKSEGNFMYLTLVLDALAGDSPTVRGLELEELPRGLIEYYERRFGPWPYPDQEAETNKAAAGLAES